MKKLHKKFQDLAKTCYDIDILNYSIDDNMKELIKINEEMYHSQVKKVANSVARNKYKMVLISGPSSSGKTTTANFIGKELINKGIGSLIVSIDDFFIDLKDRPLLDDGSPDYESLQIVDIKTFNKFFTDLLTKQKAKMPKYDFKRSRRGGWETVTINKDAVLIVEGTHALNPALIQTHEFDDSICKVYACVNSVYNLDNTIIADERDLRLMRRAYRDSFCRGKTPIETIEDWKHVCEGEDKYIAPYKSSADMFIDSAHAYEISVFANYLQDLIIPHKNNKTVERLLDIFQCVTKLSKSVIPHDSLLWEFFVNKE